VYALPFSLDSASGEICIKNVCQPVESYPPPLDSIPARSAPLDLVFTEPECRACFQRVIVVSQISKKPDVAEKCGYSYCDNFKLSLDCGCETPPVLPNLDFSSQRLNIDLRDDNNDRKADDNTRANPATARLDRFLTGDTMHTTLRAVIPPGGLSVFDYRMFTELWQNDVGTNGSDDFNFNLASGIFTNGDRFKYIGGRIVLKKVNGTRLECPFNTVAALSDVHTTIVARPNNKPPSILDQGITMFHQFQVDPSKLCFPSGTRLEAGDSLIITGNYRFGFNFISSAFARPPLMNFRNTVCGTDRVVAGTFDSLACYPGRILQYSGYLEKVQFPIYGIRVCTTAAEILPFRYELRIARPNMFPFEVRPIARLQNMLHDLPPTIGLPTANLQRLNLQDTFEVARNIPMTPTQVGARFRLDFAPLFTQPMDEGYNATVNFTFAPNCTFNGTTAPARSEVTNIFANTGLRSPITSRLDSTRLAYFGATPRLNLALKDSIINVGTQVVTADFDLENSSPFPASHSWLVIESDGALDDLEILRLPDLTPVPRIGNVLQTGDLPAFGSVKLRLRARSNACKKITVTISYGWNCSPLTSLSSETCGVQSNTIELRPRIPVLELVPPAIIPPLRLCTPSDYYEFEVFNANEGRAYNVLANIKLPSGFRVLPGTSQLSYPKGAPYVNLSDPQVQAGNTWQWTPVNASALLQNEGLFGFSEAQTNGRNSLKIRFKVQAECGAAANSQPFFGTEASLPCGLGSNVLRKPGPALLILGLMPGYATLPNLKADKPLTCGANTLITATITADAVPTAGDSIYISLPPGISYVNGSYKAGNNAPASQPVQVGAVLKWPLPTSNWTIGTALQFTFEVKYDGPAGCDDKTMLIATRELATANCANQNCAAFITTGEGSLVLNTRNPELVLKNQGVSLQGTDVRFTGELENIGSVAAPIAVVLVYYDQNGNGVIDTGEPLAGTFPQTQNMNPGAVRSIGGPLTLPADAALCRLIAVIPATENCACTTRIYPFDQRTVVNTAIGRCKVEAVPVGVEPMNGHTYQWLTTTGLSCTTCANGTYTPGPDVKDGQLVTLILEDRAGGCVTERRFDIQFDATPNIITPNSTICQGESVLLEATPGGTAYTWSGPGAAGNNASSVLVQPLATALYRVTVTLPGGCTGSGSARITVLRQDILTLPALKTCIGNPVQVLDAFTDQEGVYSRTLQGTDGCDSVILQELKVFPSLTQAIVPVCEGDSVRVFNKWVKKAGVECATFTGFSGCDSLHCIDVKVVPPPQLTVPDSVTLVRGQTVTLTARPGLARYMWTPDYKLSCNNCPNPNASPDSTTIYTLQVEDENKCKNAVDYRVIVFPPCFEAFRVPNVFTPDGDQVNDTFRAVPLEGSEKVQSLVIYNRWGQKIFASSATDPQWDGNVEGKPAPTDVYLWFMTIDCRGQLREQRGEVTLLR
jgi:gliding motility-associated-like protein